MSTVDMLPCSEREPFMGFLYAHFDESGKKSDHLVVTFCGVCGVRSRIRKFEEAWGVLLRRYGIPGGFHTIDALRYSRPYGTIPAQKPEDRLEALKPFADCINKHLEIGMIQAWEVEGNSGQWSVLQNQASLGKPDDPYFVAFVRAMIELAKYVGDDGCISLICDHDQETALKAYAHWRGVCNVDPELNKKIVALTFADDKHFPALQAADFASWLARREAAYVLHGKTYKFKPLYDYLTATRRRDFRCSWSYCFADKEKQQKIKNELEAIK